MLCDKQFYFKHIWQSSKTAPMCEKAVSDANISDISLYYAHKMLTKISSEQFISEASLLKGIQLNVHTN